MKILCIDTDGVGLAFCLRCVQAGHEVRWFIKERPCNNQDTGKGFGIDKINNWVPSMKWADLVFCTSNDDYISRLDTFKDKSINIYAPSQDSVDLEIKRGEGMEFLELHGIEVPAYKTFKSLADAEKYVWKNERRFVFKTLGDNADKSLSYCSKSPADMIARLQRWQKMNLNVKGDVMLQEFIPGIEMGVSCWMSTKGFIGKPNENFEHKKLMPGDCGPNTGEMGTLAKYVEKSKLFDEVLKPLEKSLLKLGHLGDVDINCIIDDKGQPWPLEFTNRPGWPIFNIMMVAHKGDPAQWMQDACNGKDTLEVSNDVTLGVVIAQPDFPYCKAPVKESAGIPIYGITKKNQKYIQPQSVMMDKLPDMEGEKIVEKDMWATSGPYVAVVTGTGKTIKQASKRVYGTIDELSMSNMIYRDDIGECCKIDDLKKMGYAMEFDYGDEK